MEKTFKNYIKMFALWLKIGLFTFGGGYAMIALIQNEISEKRNWFSVEEMTKIIAIAETTPGPIAINSATYVGYKMLGFWGAFFATVGVAFPSFVIIFIISLFFDNLLQYKIVANAFLGIKAGVSALIILAGFKILKSSKNKNVLFYVLFILTFAATTLIGVFSWNFSSLYFIIIGGIVGLIVYTTTANRPKPLLSDNDKKLETKNTDDLNCTQEKQENDDENQDKGDDL